MEANGQLHDPGPWHPGKEHRCPSIMRLVGPQGWSGRLWPQPGFEPQIVHTIVWWLKQLGFCVAPRKCWDGTWIRPWPWLLPSRTLPTCQFIPLYSAVQFHSIIKYGKIMYILLLCSLHSSLSLALLIFCTKFYIVNRRWYKKGRCN